MFKRNSTTYFIVVIVMVTMVYSCRLKQHYPGHYTVHDRSREGDVLWGCEDLEYVEECNGIFFSSVQRGNNAFQDDRGAGYVYFMDLSKGLGPQAIKRCTVTGLNNSITFSPLGLDYRKIEGVDYLFVTNPCEESEEAGVYQFQIFEYPGDSIELAQVNYFQHKNLKRPNDIDIYSDTCFIVSNPIAKNPEFSLMRCDIRTKTMDSIAYFPHDWVVGVGVNKGQLYFHSIQGSSILSYDANTLNGVGPTYNKSLEACLAGIKMGDNYFIENDFLYTTEPVERRAMRLSWLFNRNRSQHNGYAGVETCIVKIDLNGKKVWRSQPILHCNLGSSVVRVDNTFYIGKIFQPGIHVVPESDIVWEEDKRPCP
jgi:hypothetical protein